jgi:hypothetical protein
MYSPACHHSTKRTLWTALDGLRHKSARIGISISRNLTRCHVLSCYQILSAFMKGSECSFRRECGSRIVPCSNEIIYRVRSILPEAPSTPSRAKLGPAANVWQAKNASIKCYESKERRREKGCKRTSIRSICFGKELSNRDMWSPRPDAHHKEDLVQFHQAWPTYGAQRTSGLMYHPCWYTRPSAYLIFPGTKMKRDRTCSVTSSERGSPGTTVSRHTVQDGSLSLLPKVYRFTRFAVVWLTNDAKNPSLAPLTCIAPTKSPSRRMVLLEEMMYSSSLTCSVTTYEEARWLWEIIPLTLWE